jgi:hypothetical protein
MLLFIPEVSLKTQSGIRKNDDPQEFLIAYEPSMGKGIAP